MSMTDSSQKRIVVAGATGFIGTELGQHLAGQHHLIGLTRSNRAQITHYNETRRVDLFSRQDTIDALKNADVAVYLVHSMMPSARLVQASFDVLDLLCADNFAYAAAANKIKHIIYIGGLQPTGDQNSKHLQSRKEVEQALAAHGVPVTTLRAGLVIGGKGSSFQILRRLVQRLPTMICPSWTNTLTSPVAISDVTWAIDKVIQHEEPKTAVYDLGVTSPVTYKKLMAQTSFAMGLSRTFIPIPLVTPTLSRLWVSLVTGAPKALVAPLIHSLQYQMVARNDPLFRLVNDPKTPIDKILPQAVRTANESDVKPRAFRRLNTPKSAPKVLSVQRAPLKAGQGPTWAADLYLKWLPSTMRGFNPISVTIDGDIVEFRLGSKGLLLLSFQRQQREDFATFVITGGCLAKTNHKGRLEFRSALNNTILLIGVYDFEPRLPWWIYRFTQATFHLWVMKRFIRFLSTQNHHQTNRLN